MNMCYCALLEVMFSFLFVSMSTVILLDLLTSLYFGIVRHWMSAFYNNRKCSQRIIVH